jgi:hypothetical protein
MNWAIRHIASEEFDPTGGRRQQSAHNLEQCGLARPVRPDERTPLPGRQRQRHTVKSLQSAK